MNPKTPAPAPRRKPRRNPWPYAIIAWFVLFISGMATWAVVAVRQDLDLVRPDYYEEEIRYQKQIDRLNRTEAVRGQVSVTHDAARHELTLKLPAAHANRPIDGRIEFYRPSDARLDFEKKISLDPQGSERIETGRMRPGLWKVRVHWKVGGEEFFYDQSVIR